MTEYLTPKGIYAPKSAVEQFAEEVAKSLGYTPGGSLEEIVSLTGGSIVTGSTGSEDAESGSIVARGPRDYTIYISRHTSRHRDRFTIAHELGHLMMHYPSLEAAVPGCVMRATRWVDMTDPDQQRAEWEANWFAAAFLMPGDEVREIFQKGGLDLVQYHFDVSPAAARTRLNSLKIG